MIHTVETHKHNDRLLDRVKVPNNTYWPPSGRSRPMTLSCGLSSPVYTAKLAGEPEYG